jgi:hypothetical protein
MQRTHRTLGLLLLQALLALGQAAPPVPVVNRWIVRGFEGNWKLLAAGVPLELYGEHLAPRESCGTAKAPYPQEICGVRVLVGGIPAPLLYAGAGQINLIIPTDAPAEGLVPLVVCSGGVCGAPLSLRFGTRTALLTLEGAAYVHMPVWIHVEPPRPHRVYYPCWESPWRIPGQEFEVRRNGRTLAPASPARAQPPPDRAGDDTYSCESGRLLPLHLLYRFDEPGTYSVRLTARKGSAVLYESDWTDIEIEPFSEAAREALLRSAQTRIEAGIPPSDVLRAMVSLLAWPDDKALALLLKAIPAVVTRCRNEECARLWFGKAALAAFDDVLLRARISRARLLELCPPDGTCR